MGLFVAVIAAEVVDTSSTLDVVFPARPNQLGVFKSNKLVQITIPADSFTRLRPGTS